MECFLKNLIWAEKNLKMWVKKFLPSKIVKNIDQKNFISKNLFEKRFTPFVAKNVDLKMFVKIVTITANS